METTEGGPRARQGRPARARAASGRRWGWALAAAVLAAGTAVVWQATAPPSAYVEPRAPHLIFELHGPNDGEPINSRFLSLDVATNYSGAASLSIDVNKDFLFSRPL